MPFFGVPLRNGVPIGLGSVAGFGISPFDPSQLFASGEQGAWYDPSDFSTMFQDAAGTTPVTAVEQPVGLILDKSKGIVETQLINDPSFDSGITGWGAQFPGADITYAWNSSLKSLTVTRGAGGIAGRPTYAVNVTAGVWYKLTIATNAAGLANSAAFAVTDSVLSAAVFSNSVFTPQGMTATTVTKYGFATSTGTVYIALWCANNVSAEFLSVDFKSVSGNHASQATTTARPVLSARVNLLTYTEQFNNSAWQKLAGGTGVTPVVTADYGTAPDGTQTADRIQFDLGATPNSATSRLFQNPGGTPDSQSIWLKTTDGTTKTLYFNNSSPSFKSITVTGTWTRFTGNFSGPQFQFGLTGPSGSGGAGTIQTDTTADVLAWGADLRVTNDGVGLPAYQRVVTSTNYDTSGFPLYLAFDGTDDSLATASIDFSGTDKATLWAGVRKLSDAAQNIIVELSNGANAGSFALSAAALSGTYRNRSSGTSTGNADTSAIYNAPITNVLAGICDVASDTSILRVNGVQSASSATDQGTGNWGNAYPLYVGSRGGASLRLTGRIYSLIVRGAASTDAQIASTEAWVNGKTGAY